MAERGDGRIAAEAGPQASSRNASAVAADFTVRPVRADCRWDQRPDGLRKMESLWKGAE